MFSQLHFNLNVILLQWKRSVSWSCHVFVQCSWILSPNMRWFPWRTYFTCPHNDIREVMIHKTSHTPSVLNSSLMETSVPYIRNQVKFGSRTSSLYFLIFHSIVSTSRLPIFYVTDCKHLSVTDCNNLLSKLSFFQKRCFVIGFCYLCLVWLAFLFTVLWFVD